MGNLITDLFRLFCLENEIDNFSVFSLFFLIDCLEYLDIVLLEIKDIKSKTAFGALFSLTLKEMTLSGCILKIYLRKFLHGKFLISFHFYLMVTFYTNISKAEI